jgi:isoaspartyl peptidase/L-asparaginase-like protein (Ntn-hydrolase superfamily)
VSLHRIARARRLATPADPVAPAALRAVVAAVAELEACGLVNAGRGSCLNERGRVECDAAVMALPAPSTPEAQPAQPAQPRQHDQHVPALFGGVGAAAGLRSPVTVAARLALEAARGRVPPLRLVPPQLLCGDGVRAWARNRGLPTASDAELDDFQARAARRAAAARLRG